MGESAPDDGVQLREALGCKVCRCDVPTPHGAATGAPAPAQPGAGALGGEEQAHLFGLVVGVRLDVAACEAMSRPPPLVSRSSGLVNTAHRPGMALGLAVLAAVAAHAGP